MIPVILNFYKSTFSLFRKLIIVFIVFFTVISMFLFFIQKNRIPMNENNAMTQNRKEIYASIKELKKDNSNISKLTLLVYRGSLCGLIGEACTDTPADGDTNFDQSLFGKITGFITIPYANPPASSISWLKQGMEKAGFIPNTYAAEGIGFASIKGYMGLWTLFRDLAFMLLVLFMISIGFMIMFRVKLDSQTAISIESALPRIVITMLLITFSFAIAGFLIDLMYVIITVSISLIFKLDTMQQALMAKNPGVDINQLIANEQGRYVTASGRLLWPDSLGSIVFSGTSIFAVGDALYQVLPNTIRFPLQTVLALTLGHAVNLAVLKWPKSFLGAFHGVGAMGFTFGVQMGNLLDLLIIPIEILLFLFLANWLPVIVLGLVVLLTVLVFMFKIFFMLLSSYLKIIMYIIFAPFILLFNVIPGNGSFGWWFKNLFGELIVFPTVIIISMVGRAILEVNTAQIISNPNADVFRLPFLYGIEASDINLLVSVGLILLTPDFIKMVKDWIGVTESPFNFGPGTFLGGASMVTSVAGFQGQLGGIKNVLIGHKPNEETHGIFGLGNTGFGKWATGLSQKAGLG